MSFLGELRGGDRFGALALLDLGRGSVRRDLELELDQELHVLHPALPHGGTWGRHWFCAEFGI